MSDERFDWDDDETIVVRKQMGLAVYTNPHGDIVIRQEGDYPDDDVWVIFNPRHALTMARRVLEEAGIDPASAFRDTGRDSTTANIGSENSNIGPAGAVYRDSNRDTSATAPKDKTAAERQRRYRERHRRTESHSGEVMPLLAAE